MVIFAVYLLIAAVAATPTVDYSQCSFPFTYGGAVQYSCIQNIAGVTGSGQYGCFQVNRTGAICQNQPTGYTCPVTNTTVSINSVNYPTTSVCGWTVIMQRLNGAPGPWGSTWSSYRNGFGTPGQDFWIGLEQIHQLTSTGNWRLRIELYRADQLVWQSGEYWQFSIGTEASGYVLTANGFVGGDSMLDGFNLPGPNSPLKQNGMKFTTVDVDNDNNPTGSCSNAVSPVLAGGAGWWFNNCMSTLLTAPANVNNMWPFGVPSARFAVLASRLMIKPQ